MTLYSKWIRVERCDECNGLGIVIHIEENFVPHKIEGGQTVMAVGRAEICKRCDGMGDIMYVVKDE